MLGDAVRATRQLALTNYQNWQRTYAMAQVALAKRYSGSALGVAWAVIRPAIYIAAYWFAVSVGMRGGASAAVGAPYLLWLVPGNLAWFFMSDCLRETGQSIRRNSQFVTKMTYPIATLPVSEVGNGTDYVRNSVKVTVDAETARRTSMRSVPIRSGTRGSASFPGCSARTRSRRPWRCTCGSR